MYRHWCYLKYVLRHKYFVFIASRRLKVSLWRAIIHDISKFYISEWTPYVETFYAPDGSKQYRENLLFSYAWNSHQKRNKHHWQYWILKMDKGEIILLDIPDKYIREMIADWMGAGRAITGKWDVIDWYKENSINMILGCSTRTRIRHLLFELGIYGE